VNAMRQFENKSARHWRRHADKTDRMLAIYRQVENCFMQYRSLKASACDPRALVLSHASTSRTNLAASGVPIPSWHLS
jgi:hypothetical protein